MRWMGLAIGLAVLTAVSGCGALGLGQGAGALPAEPAAAVGTAGAPTAAVAGDPVEVALAVRDVKVSVPRSLKVSEAEVYYPVADIVWRGDPAGNRYEQIEAIFAAALAKATPPLTEGLPVTAEIEVTRFHSVTNKARYTLGGVHSMKFLLTIRDAATGAVLSGPREVIADVKAAGGQRAVRQDYAGVTQKSVVINHLAKVIRAELSTLAVDPALAATVAEAPAG